MYMHMFKKKWVDICRTVIKFSMYHIDGVHLGLLKVHLNFYAYSD